jgi:glucosaminylphosphatidylinositol acyltransferase
MALIADFLLNVWAFLFATTVYSSTPAALSIFLATPAVLLFLLGQRSDFSGSNSPQGATKILAKKSSTKEDLTATTNSPLPTRPFVTHYRGLMMIVTCLAILAVDFPIFPRRYAKVETWGTSLMDLGVGNFVFSAGVVTARALFKSPEASTAKQEGSISAFTDRFVKALRHSLPLFVLGFIRLYSVKGLDYAEHVTEYGVHWNFFFTLALLPPFVEVADSIGTRAFKYHEVVALLLAAGYELILHNTSLLSYILISPRGPSLLSKNREGIFSFIGYLSIFLTGRGIGVHIMHFDDVPPMINREWRNSRTPPVRKAEIEVELERKRMLMFLAIFTGWYSMLYWFCTNVNIGNLNVSRRLANLPYVLWVVAFNTSQLFLFGLIEHFGPGFTYIPTAAEKTRLQHATSRILRVFNSNGLVIFLVANLGTGLVNMTINTLDASPAMAMGILSAYAAGISAVALGLDVSGIKIKL